MRGNAKGAQQQATARRRGTAPPRPARRSAQQQQHRRPANKGGRRTKRRNMMLQEVERGAEARTANKTITRRTRRARRLRSCSATRKAKKKMLTFGILRSSYKTPNKERTIKCIFSYYLWQESSKQSRLRAAVGREAAPAGRRGASVGGRSLAPPRRINQASLLPRTYTASLPHLLLLRRRWARHGSLAETGAGGGERRWRRARASGGEECFVFLNARRARQETK